MVWAVISKIELSDTAIESESEIRRSITETSETSMSLEVKSQKDQSLL